MVEYYVGLPMLPIGKEIIIKSIRVYNRHPLTQKIGPLMEYSMFSALNPSMYPEGINKHNDYMPTDQVSPVMVIDTSGVEYQTSPLLWLSLALINNRISNQNVFPKRVFIDSDNQWMCELMNIAIRRRRRD